MAEPTSQKPYLLRALFEWCVDNGYTPYVSVQVDERTRVPAEFVRNGEIVLNIGPLAANRLKLGNEFIDFTARFGGVAREIIIPVAVVSAIYARETGHGMSFEIERAEAPRADDTVAPVAASVTELTHSHTAETQPKPPPAPGPAGPAGKPTLRRVK
jgi:stringent starvation protein B